VTLAEFRARYASGFAAFVSDRSESSMSNAYELGREAVRARLSMLEVARAHHESLARAVAEAPNQEEAAAICAAVTDFLVESLAAFEMVQRGFSDAQRAASVERRNARMLRQLSALLTDQLLAAEDPEPLEEAMQLVAEHVREMTDARRARVYVAANAGGMPLVALSESLGNDAWTDVKHARTGTRQMRSRQGTSVRVPLRSLSGFALGWIAIEDSLSGDFSPADHAVVTHVAQMTGAAIERARAYQAPSRPP